MENRIYYVSQYDNLVHNINDKEHHFDNRKKEHRDCKWVFIGTRHEDGFEVYEEVELWTIKEIGGFY